MRVTVFGASGSVGSEVVSQALEQGHQVRAVYRTNPNLPPTTHLEVVVIPDLFQSDALLQAIAHTDGIVVTLGLRRKNGNNPFSALASPPDLTSRFAASLIQAMHGWGAPRRVVALSAAGVGDSWKTTNLPFRLLAKRSKIGLAYRDLNRMEQLFRESDVDWTCVRPTTFTDGPLTKHVRLTNAYTLASRISRADVAWYLLQCVEEAGRDDQRTPMITH